MPTTVPRAQKDDVIYEMNVRGMTANDSSIPQAERGTYAGAAQKAAYLQSLGVTAVELQPVQEVQNDQDNIYEASHGGAAPPNGDTGWNSGQYYKDNYCWCGRPPTASMCQNEVV
jgi:pullulanase/glycogen debranching enzyme